MHTLFSMSRNLLLSFVDYIHKKYIFNIYSFQIGITNMVLQQAIRKCV